ncbi:MAG: hypothetical protein NUV97_00270 [archaeon]|nr:hypothetical protein [archaeon]MCR4323611.1 hypothetical protein [Nanoarchaeota archaeon]
MKKFFVLGRNPTLSRLEVLSFLEARKREYKEILFDENLLVLEFPGEEKVNVQEFGGVLKIGDILFEGEEKDFRNYLDGEEIIPSDKFSYSIFGNGDEDLIKQKFKSEKKKAVLRRGRNRMKMQEGSFLNVGNADFSLFYYKKNDMVLFGLVNQDYNYEPVKDRDMNKPVRREELAISPRLAKILINLAGSKPGSLLLDPFCGIGGILQESLVKGIKCYGIDHNQEAIKDAEKNLKWLCGKYNIRGDYRLENIDSRKAPDLQFGSIATETPLGVVLRKKPNDNHAKKIILDFEALMIPILLRLKKVKKPGAKISITFPVVRGFHVNAGKVAGKVGLRILNGPILESREDQFISRDIVVFV